MPQLYPQKPVTKKASNGVSDIPYRSTEDPKKFLFSKNFHVLRKNKSMMLPSKVMEQPLKNSPEKQKPPVMSMFRRMQLEDIRDRELMQAKKNRLFAYISQKFVAKFGSTHKSSIAASVEDFLVDHQTVNIDINDLRLLDAIIGDSIDKRINDGIVSQDTSAASSLSGSGRILNMNTSGSGRSFHNKNKKLNAKMNGSNSQPLLHRTEEILPLGPNWKIIRQHRSLTAEERHQSEIDNIRMSHIKQQDNLDSQAYADIELSRMKEIENYRPKEYMQETMKIFSNDQITRSLEGHERRVAEYQYQSEQEADRAHRQKILRKKKKIEEEKEALYYEKKQMEKQRRQLALKAKAVYQRELSNTQQAQNLTINGTNGLNELTLDERVDLDSQSRIHRKIAPPGDFKMTRNEGLNNEGYFDTYNYENEDENNVTFSIENNVTYHRDNISRENNVSGGGDGQRRSMTRERDTNTTRQRENEGNNIKNNNDFDQMPYEDDISTFKLSNKTFKKTVLQKQEEYREKIKSHLAEKKKSLVDFYRLGDRNTMVEITGEKKENDKIGNLNHFTVNKGFFVNRDIEKFSKSVSTM